MTKTGRLRQAAWALLLPAVMIGMLVPGSSDYPRLRPLGASPASIEAASTTRAQQAVQLRTSLEKILGQHVFLSARLVRLRLAGDEAYVQAAVSALSRNTADLSALVTQVYGTEHGPEFIQRWESHEASIVEYARGLADKDQSAQNRARTSLAAYPEQMAQYLQTLTDGALPAGATQPAIARHIRNQLALADRASTNDIAGSYQIEREDYHELYRLATAIAAGIASQGGGTLPPDFDSPQRRLESSLGELLGEHWELAVDLMHAAGAGGSALDAVAVQVNANTRDLARAMNVLFGAQTGQRFLNLWGDHLDALVSYAQSPDVPSGPQARAATDQLERVQTELGALFSTGTDGRLAAPGIVQAFGAHDQMLLQEFDATAHRAFDDAYRLEYDGFQQMFAMTSQLAGAVGPQLASRLPVGGVQTGGGALAK